MYVVYSVITGPNERPETMLGVTRSKSIAWKLAKQEFLKLVPGADDADFDVKDYKYEDRYSDDENFVYVEKTKEYKNTKRRKK